MLQRNFSGATPRHKWSDSVSECELSHTGLDPEELFSNRAQAVGEYYEEQV